MYKPLLSTLIAISSVTAVKAQQTLTAANFNPVVGNAFYIVEADETGFNPGASGANVTWNFTSLIPRKNDTGLIMACTAVTPTCATFVPAGNPNLVQTVPAPLKVKDYIYAGADSIAHWGYYQSPDTTLTLTDPLITMKYPFSYMTNFTDSFKGTYQIPLLSFPVTFYEKGQVTVNCDGWGKLMLPTRNDSVLRVHMTEVHRDSAHLLSVDSVITYTIDQYVWYKPNYHAPLLLFTTATMQSSSTPLYTLVAYAPKDNTGVNDVTGTEAKIDLFPNPSKGLVNISWEDMPMGTATVTVTDMTGRNVLQTNLNVHSGNGQTQLQMQGAAPGIYFVNVKAGNVNYNGKVVVE